MSETSDTDSISEIQTSLENRQNTEEPIVKTDVRDSSSPEISQDINRPSTEGSTAIQMFAQASQLSIQGTNSFTTVGRSVYHVNPSVNLVLHDPAASSSAMTASPSSRAASVPNQFVQQPEHESEVYARILMPKRHGYPLWYPQPPSNIHTEYQKSGIRIGDVGLITADGGFDFLFNICLPSDHPINDNSVPENFQPITPEIRERDITTDPIAWKAGSHVSNGSVRTLEPRSITEFIGKYSFEGFASEGALLTLPEGAMRVNLLPLASFCNYAGQNGHSWYKFANGPRGRMAANGSLYLVTGFDKVRSWGTASFSSILGDSAFKMSFIQPTVTGDGRLQNIPSFPFIWNETGCAATKEGPYLQRRDIEEERPINQTIFLRGFRVALPESIWASLMRKANAVSITDMDPATLLQKGGFVPYLSQPGWTGYFPFGSSSSTESGRRHTDSLPETTGADVMLISNVAAPRVDLHPLYSINQQLLQDFPEAEVAVTHDDVWCSALDEEMFTSLDKTKIWNKISQSYLSVCTNGFVTLNPREGGDTKSGIEAIRSRGSIPANRSNPRRKPARRLDGISTPGFLNMNEAISTINNPDSKLIRLKALLNPMTSASYDSYEGDRRSECFPDTCVQVLNDIEKWIKGESHQAPIYILYGVAGIGKSTVAHTIAMRAAALGLLGASFFFSWDEDSKTVARHFFPTIAYQLSCYDSTFATHISRSLDRNPDVPSKLLGQLTRLLLEPLRNVLSQKSTPTLVVVDALDECEDKCAEELLALLGHYVPRIKGLKILITSRPKAHLRDMLDQGVNHNKFSLHEIEDPIVQSDIRLYLRFRLSEEEIRKASRRQNATWKPTNEEMEMLCRICRTLFIIAATAIKFILSSSNSTPKKQLSRLLDGVSASSLAGSEYNDALDHIYIRILFAPLSGREGDDREWLQELNRVLGALIVLSNPLPCEALASLLEMDPDDLEATLGQLHSLVTPSTNTRDSDIMLRIHHKSFSDFITDKKRIQQALKTCTSSTYPGLDSLLWINVIDQHLQLAKACFRIMDKTLKWNMADIDEKDLYKDKEDIPHVRPELIPRELAYGAMHWASHLRATQGFNKDSELQKSLDGWASHHILGWMETMVILDQVNNICGILRDAIESLPEKSAADNSGTEHRKVSELLSDACRFVQQGREVMKLSPMHIYRSCLPFVPVKTLFYKLYGNMAMGLRVGIGEAHQWNALFATLVGHSGSSSSVAFSADSSLLVSGSYDKTVRLWDPSTGAHISTLTGHSDQVSSVAFSADGSRLASGSHDKTVRLWDPSTGAHISTLTGHSGQVSSVAFSADGSRLASGSRDETVRLWDAFLGTHIANLTGHLSSINSISFSADRSLLASGSSDKTVRLWDSSTGAHISTLTGHWAEVSSVAFSADGSRLASGSHDKTVRLWDPSTGAHISTLTGHSAQVSSVGFSADGSRLASGSHDKTVRLWDPSTGEHISTLIGHSDWISSVAFSADSSRLASGSRDKTVRLWDACPGTQIANLTGHLSSIKSISFSADSSLLAFGSDDKTVRLWDSSTGAHISTLTGHWAEVSAVAFSADGSRLASASHDGTVQLWDPSTGAHISTLTGHSAQVSSVAFSADSSRLASGSRDKTIRLWDPSTGAHISTLTGHLFWVSSLAFTADGSQLASGSYDKTVRLWDPSTGTHLSTLTGHLDWVCFVAFSADGSRLASGSHDKTVRLWDPSTGACLSHTILPDSIRSVLVLPNDSQIVHQAQSPGSPPLGHRITDATSLLLLVDRKKPSITGIMTASLTMEEGDDLRWKVISVCWLPPDIRVKCLSVAQSDPRMVIGCEGGHVLTLDFCPRSSNPHTYVQ